MKAIEVSQVSILAPHLVPGSEQPVLLTQDGRIVAAVVPVDETDVDDLLLSINPRFEAILQASRQRLETEGTLSTAEVRRLLGLVQDS